MSRYSWLSERLLPWYREHRRDLPWRRTTDPYPIWLSEVILQQTRVDQGLAYWQRFMDHYPSVADLAAAEEDKVLKLWQGLGYYSRARNLLTAARQVVERHGGHFPNDHSALLQLKGVGDYTAAAIASIAFGSPEPVVDGNVYRVLSRLLLISTPIDSTAGKREFRERAAELLDAQAPGDHNQALMELGATVCTPRKPLCHQCPLADKCLARAHEAMDRLPVKVGKTKVRIRHFNYLHIEGPQGLLMQRRGAGDIWEGLHQLPLVESTKALGTKGLLNSLRTVLPGTVPTARSERVVHVLSHQRIQAVFWRTTLAPDVTRPPEWQWVPLDRIHTMAVPRLVERWLNGELPEKRA